MTYVLRKVEVTQEDITAGKPSSCRMCPVQLAMVRTFPEFENIDVLGQEVEIRYNNWWSNHKLPEEAQAFIQAFDDSKPVEPFSFDMELSI